MNFLQKIQHKLTTNTLSKLGYTKENKHINRLIKAKTIDEFLDVPFYDFKYTSVSLLEKICHLTGLNVGELHNSILEYEHNKKENLKQAYIFVFTAFKRKNESIFALAALESKRNIKIDREVFSKDVQYIDEYISKTITDHYSLKEGKLPLWGDIKAYVFFDLEGRRINYNTEGVKFE